jgi:hypothetical protein
VEQVRPQQQGTKSCGIIKNPSSNTFVSRIYFLADFSKGLSVWRFFLSKTNLQPKWFLQGNPAASGSSYGPLYSGAIKALLGRY